MASQNFGRPLLERDAALREIDGALAHARSGAGSLMVIEGAAGEGKTALLAAARERGDDVQLTVLDDVHELPASALVDLAGRAQTIADRPELVLVAFRPDEPGADEQALDGLRTVSGVRRVTLAPLGREAVAAMVRARRPDLTERETRTVHAATGGNPRYLEELLAGDPSRTHVLAVGDRAMTRIGRLGSEAVSLTAAMVVLGDGHRLGLAAQVAGLEPARAGEIAHRLRRMGLLESEDPVSFTQPLVRRSIYHGLTDAERHRLHSLAAAILRDAGCPVDEVADHLAALICEGSSKVATSLAQAARHAADSDQAIRWLRRALEEAAPEPPRSELLRSLGQLELVARDSSAIAHLREALELTTEPTIRATMGISLAEILAYVGRWDEMMVVLRSVEGDVRAVGGEVHVRFAAVLAVATGHDAARINIFEDEREGCERLAQGPSWSAHALAAVLGSISAQRGEPPEYALRMVERSLEGGILLGEQGGGGWAVPHVLTALILTDATDRALALCHAVEAASARAGSGLGGLAAAAYRTWIHVRLGDLTRAEVELRRALAGIADDSMQMIALTVLFGATEVLLERPGVSDLHQTVEAMQIEPAFGNTWSGAMHLWVRGRVRLLGADRLGAIADLRAVGRIAGALRTGPLLSPWRSMLACALPPEERVEAVALVEEELDLTRAGGSPRAHGVAMHALGLLTPGSAGLDLLREAEGILREASSRLEHARVLIDLGAMLRRGRHISEARQPLASGLELASASGASRLATRARAELAAAAGRPPRRQPTDQQLTPSELRVAQLAATGRSNRDIAGDLFVSVKTIETHLSHAYTKLGLSGRGARRAMGAALATHQPITG